jgi:hypothetical protein
LIRDSYALGDAAAQRSTLIDHLVSLAIIACANDGVEAILPRLGVTATEHESEGLDAQYRAQLRALLESLLEERELSRGFERAIFMERATQLDTVEMLIGSPDSTFFRRDARRLPVALLFRPLFKHSGCRMAEYMSYQLHAARALTWPEHMDRLAPAQRLQIDHFGGLSRPTAMLTSILLPSLSRAYLLHFRLIAERRMAAIAIALRLYALEKDHDARTLHELVAAGYLTRVPADPFSRDADLCYAPDLPKPLLYSVSQNGVDDGGTFVMHPTGYVSRDSPDLVFFLDGQRPFQPPP